MTEQAFGTVVIPCGLGPADAEVVRANALSMIETAKAESVPLPIDVDGDSPTPCAIQIVVSATRTAELMNVDLQFSERGAKILSDLEQN